MKRRNRDFNIYIFIKNDRCVATSQTYVKKSTISHVLSSGTWKFEIILAKAVVFPRGKPPSTDEVTSWLYSLIGALLCLKLHCSDFLIPKSIHIVSIVSFNM